MRYSNNSSIWATWTRLHSNLRCHGIHAQSWCQSDVGTLGAYHSQAVSQETHGADLLLQLQACTKSDCQ